MRTRKGALSEQPRGDAHANGTEPPGCPSEGQSARALLGGRRPRWIRSLASRLGCFYLRCEKRVLEPRQNPQSQGTGHRRRLRLRHCKRGNREHPSCKPWQTGSEAGVSVASAPAEAHAPCPRSEAESCCAEPELDFPHTDAVRLCVSSPKPTADEVGFGSGASGTDHVMNDDAKMLDVQPASPSSASPTAACTGPLEAGDLTDRVPIVYSEPQGKWAGWATVRQPVDPNAAVPNDESSGTPQVDVWPLVTLGSLGESGLRDAFEKLEEQRHRFNWLQRQAALLSAGTFPWNRRVEMQELSDRLINASVTSLLGLDCAMPCVHCHDGLQVWKGDSAVGNFACRATFLLPVEPRRYAMFASNGELRCQWDRNITEQHVVEQLDEGHDICYVAFRRFATVYPRDVVTLRVKCRVPIQPRIAEPPDGIPDILRSFHEPCHEGPEPEGEDATAYTSMSCSIDHPDAPESPGRVRMDIRINAYLAKPVRTPFGLWSEVTLVNESDPGGWIPAAITRTMSAKLLPSTVEKFSAQIMTHYNITWSGSAVGFAARKLKANKLVLS